MACRCVFVVIITMELNCFFPDWYVAWTGLNDISTEKEYVWSNGKTAVFTNWDQGQPSVNLSSEDCVVIGGGNGTSRETWKETNCEVQLNFVCEKI